MAVKTADNRTRNWTFVLYPESCANNWREILDDLHIEWIESPLHDADLNADGEKKKPHWHILLMFDGKKSYEQIKEITVDKCLGTVPQKVQSARGLVRYMAHLDNPEKVQYDITKIIGHGGADVGQLLKPTSSARYVLIKEMSDYIRDNGIIYFDELYFYAMEYHFDDWFPLLCDNSAFIIKSVISSRRDRKRDVEEEERREMALAMMQGGK